MERPISWYEVLGVAPGAEPETIRRKYEERASLLRAELISGAPSNVLGATGRAQHFLDTAWGILSDPGRRQRYDEAAGLQRKGLAPSGTFGSGPSLNPPEAGFAGDPSEDALGALTALDAILGPEPVSRSARRVPVPDLRGLFYDVGMEVAGRLGLKIRSVQLTAHPMPVDGLVVDQVPRAPDKIRRDQTLMAHVWHPPLRPGR